MCRPYGVDLDSLLLFVSNIQRKFYFFDGWGTRFMKYDHLFFTPPAEKFLILKVEPGQVVVAGRGFDYFIFDLVSVSYRSVNQLGNGPHGRCLFIGMVSDVSV